jgi:hypothetical protein
MGAAPGLERLLARRGRPEAAWVQYVGRLIQHPLIISVPLAAWVVQCGIAAMARVIWS